MALDVWDFDPYEFGDAEFILQNVELYDEYITARVRGHGARAALRMAFGPEFACDSDGDKRIQAIERSQYFTKKFNERLQSATIEELWNPKVAVHALLSIVRDYAARDSARIRAIQELNILTHIVIVDENGKTKAGRNLADFYRDNGTDLGPKPRVGLRESDLPDPSSEKTRH